MSFEIWFSFLLASAALCMVPGPTVLLVMGQALTHGNKAVVPLIAGVCAANVVVMTFSLVGIGAVISASAQMFTILKWVGAAYLLYLGVKSWRTQPEGEMKMNTSPMLKRSVFRDSMLVTVLNPKGLVFFMAFFPIFIQPEGDIAVQMLILSATFMLASIVTVTLYAAFAGQLRSKIISTKGQKLFNRTSGGMLIGAGILTSVIK
ncbi:LysE family translocator [Vibrio sp. SCSIO 43137]|uniref:LysE family translocator n=1 Tax=Vibrio sp. SCSIO 43137 TaxID=3021011 RepID=UPI002307E1D7|nr:LysE family translocator [Vibrio sp. SCSIO 43137]WCE28813.1 LysE family translocator [Vibrio sp. SCSIO 43137]